MQRIPLLRTFMMMLIAVGAGIPLSAGTISIGPGSGPAGTYLGLAGFGITPIAGMGNDTATGFTVPAFTFGGASFTHLNVSSNGYLTVSDPATSPNNQN